MAKVKSMVAVKDRASKTKPTLRVSDESVSSMAEVFKMLADPSRLKIMLALAHEGELHVSALKDLVKQSQPAVSHHLTLLRAHKLVGYRRDGKHNFYRVDSSYVHVLLDQFFHSAVNGQKQLQFANFSLSYRSK